MAPSAKVKVLHRATDELSCGSDSPKSTISMDGEAGQQMKRLQAENESLKQRLEQVRLSRPCLLKVAQWVALDTHPATALAWYHPLRQSLLLPSKECVPPNFWLRSLSSCYCAVYCVPVPSVSLADCQYIWLYE